MKTKSPVEPVRQKRRGSLVMAFAAFLVANVIHNDFGVDFAIAPAAILVGLYWWRPKKGLLLAAAIMIAFPAFLFLKWSSLSDPSSVKPFFNHIALLLAGLFAILTAWQDLTQALRTRHQP